jgi:hypothetical protein
MSETTLVRTKHGKMVHRCGCHYAGWGVPWEWAEGLTRLDVYNAIRFTGVKCCKTCDPLGALPLP